MVGFVGLVRRLLRRLHRLAFPLPEAFRGRDEIQIAEIKRERYPRIPLTDEEFALVWREIAAVFFVPPELMRPEDRFFHELPERASLAGSDEDIVLDEVLKRLETRFAIDRIVDAKCVGDILTAIGRKRR